MSNSELPIGPGESWGGYGAPTPVTATPWHTVAYAYVPVEGSPMGRKLQIIGDATVKADRYAIVGPNGHVADVCRAEDALAIVEAVNAMFARKPQGEGS